MLSLQNELPFEVAWDEIIQGNTWPCRFTITSGGVPVATLRRVRLHIRVNGLLAAKRDTQDLTAIYNAVTGRVILDFTPAETALMEWTFGIATLEIEHDDGTTYDYAEGNISCRRGGAYGL